MLQSRSVILNFFKLPFHTHLFIGGICRLLLLIWSIVQDEYSTLPFTDIDYHVYSDAVRSLLNKDESSPYKRATYRYSPLLAWSLAPTHFLGSHSWMSHVGGKVMFIISDLLCAILLKQLVASKVGNSWVVPVWIYNPITMVISVRGSADALLLLPKLAFLLTFTHQHYMLSGLLYGLSVHVRLYPVIYGPLLLLHLFSSHKFPRFIMSSLEFGVAALMAFGGLGYACYSLYGMDFIHNTYLYHLSRVDFKHNFAPHFLGNYIQLSGLVHIPAWMWAAVRVAHQLPQLLAILYFSFICRRQAFAVGCLFVTFVFVTFNGVCTSQYFLWYIVLLPLMQNYLRLHSPLVRETLYKMAALWLLGQGVWLACAYGLEFLGISECFLLVWLASLFLFYCNCVVVVRLYLLSIGVKVK